MKKAVQIGSTFLLLLIPFTLWPQKAGLLNATEGTLHFVSLPTTLELYEELKNTPGSFKTVLSEHIAQLDIIPSGGVYQQLSLQQPDSLIVGYMQRAGSREHPLFALLIEGNTDGEYYKIDSTIFLRHKDERIVSISDSGDDLLTLNNHLIDGSIIDWLNRPDILSFERSFIPLRIRRDGSNRRRQISIENATFWGKGGTFFNHIRAYREEDRIYWMVTSFYEIADGLSILLYFYPKRDKSTPNLYTIEVPVTGSSGSVLLWKDNESAEIVGTYQRGDFFVEFLIDNAQLPAEIQQALNGSRQGSFDVSSGYSDGDIFEEFLFGNIPANILIRTP